MQLTDSARRRHALRVAGVRLAPDRMWFVGFAFLYLTLAVGLVLIAHTIVGDAWSRVGNAYYMLFSRDPHLAAVGFVWNPLPSLMVLPFLPLKAVWPPLVSEGFAGSIVSALAMAAAVMQVRGVAADWRVPTVRARLITAGFALNPMILYYASNGMSEALLIFFLVVTTRYLARWTSARSLPDLVLAGFGLALAYLTRYEAVPAAFGAVLVVALVDAVRFRGTGRARAEATADLLVFALPVACVFVAWAAATWLITGDPFAQFSSVYGNAAQIGVSGSAISSQTGQGTEAGYIYIARQLIGLAPGALIFAFVGGLVFVRRLDWRIAVVLAILGGVTAFGVGAFLTGRTLGWLRYLIYAIPMVTLLADALLSQGVPIPIDWPPSSLRRCFEPRLPFVHRRPSTFGVPRALLQRATRLVTAIAPMAIIILVLVGLPASAATMLDERNNPPEGGEGFALRPVVQLGPMFGSMSPLGQYEAGRAAAEAIDTMGLPRGAVLVDVALGFPVVLQSTNPTQFVITPDRDFEQTLTSPEGSSVRYFLVPEPVGYAALDALNRKYPHVYDTGADMGTLVVEFDRGGTRWRLYKLALTGGPTQPTTP